MKPKQKCPLEKITAIHGLDNLTLGGKRGFGWMLIMVGNIIFTAYLIIVIKIRFDSSQIYTRIDGTCRVNQVPFPSVIICNASPVSQNETRNIREILKFYKRDEVEIDAFFEALTALTHYGDKVGHFTEIVNILENQYFNVDSIMEEVHQKCENLLLHCEFNGVAEKCSEVFRQIKTMEGFCCAFNYAALNENTEDVFSKEDEDIEFYDDRKTGAIISTSKSGRSSGLTVLFDVQPHDYPAWAKTRFYGAMILINDPNDFPETTVTTSYAALGSSLNLLIEPKIYLIDPALRSVTPEQRQCWFQDEMLLAHTGRYSFETCTTECNMKRFLQFCNCVPYKYPRDLSSPICGLKDLPCLRELSFKNENTSCFCALECQDKKYKVTQNIMPLQRANFPTQVTRNVNISSVAAVKVFFDSSTCNCYKKSLLLDFTRLAGTYGGVFSLSLGASIITVVEILYLFLKYVMRNAAQLVTVYEKNNGI